MVGGAHVFELFGALDLVEGLGFVELGLEFFAFYTEVFVFVLEEFEFVAFLRGGGAHGDEDGAEDDDHATKNQHEVGDDFVGLARKGFTAEDFGVAFGEDDFVHGLSLCRRNYLATIWYSIGMIPSDGLARTEKAVLVMSRLRLAVNGPRSLMRTVVCWPFFI